METVAPMDEFLILACDGLWDVLTSQQVWNVEEACLPSPYLSVLRVSARITSTAVTPHTTKRRSGKLLDLSCCALPCRCDWNTGQAVNFVRRRLVEHHDVDAAAKELVAKALTLSSNDNVSVLVVCLQQQPR